MTARILRKRAVVEDDWILLQDSVSDLSAGGKLIVPLGRWRAERDTLLATAEAVGVLLPNTVCLTSRPAVS
jgi:uncharacterized protein (DUF934 family)